MFFPSHLWFFRLIKNETKLSFCLGISANRKPNNSSIFIEAGFYSSNDLDFGTPEK